MVEPSGEIIGAYSGFTVLTESPINRISTFFGVALYLAAITVFETLRLAIFVSRVVLPTCVSKNFL